LENFAKMLVGLTAPKSDQVSLFLSLSFIFSIFDLYF